MASVIEICNRALTKLGQGEQYISTLTDSTKEARALNRVYENVRDLVLRETDWKCLVRRGQLDLMPGKINRVIYLSTYDRFIAVGDNGLILTSTGGAAWDVQVSGVTTNLNDICLFGTSTYTIVTVGDNGVILTSPDGVTWTSRTSGTTRNIYGIGANGATLLVACGASGLILSSTDYTTWTSRTSGKNVTLRSVAVNTTGPVYVCIGDAASCISSSNGTAWTSRTIGFTSTVNGQCVTFGNSLFVAVASGGYTSYSSDGSTWTANTTITAEDLLGVAYTNAVFAAVGTAGVIFTSSNGAAWTSRASGVTDNLTCAAYSANDLLYLIMGDCVLITSYNYTTWVEIDFAPSVGYDYQYILPGGMLKILSVNTDGSETADLNMDWRIEGDYFYSSEEAVYIEYLSKITDTTRWSIHLVEAVAVRIAMEVCYEVTGSNGLKKELWQEYGQIIREARSSEYRNQYVEDEAPIKWKNAGRT